MQASIGASGDEPVRVLEESRGGDRAGAMCLVLIQLVDRKPGCEEASSSAAL